MQSSNSLSNSFSKNDYLVEPILTEIICCLFVIIWIIILLKYLMSICVSGAENIVGWALSYHVMNESEPSIKDGKLIISSER